MAEAEKKGIISQVWSGLGVLIGVGVGVVVIVIVFFVLVPMALGSFNDGIRTTGVLLNQGAVWLTSFGISTRSFMGQVFGVLMIFALYALIFAVGILCLSLIGKAIKEKMQGNP